LAEDLTMRFKLENLGCLKDVDIELGDLTIICGKNNTGKTYINYAIYGFLSIWDSIIDFNLDSEIESLFQEGTVSIDLSSFEDNFIQALNKSVNNYSKSIYKMFSVDEDFLKNANFNVIPSEYTPNYSQEISSNFFSQKQKQFLKIIKPKDSSIFEISLLIEDSLGEDKKEPTPPLVMIRDVINRTLAKAFSGYYFPEPFIITSERTGVSLFYKELDISKNIMIEQLKKKSKIEPFDFLNMLNDSLSRYSKPIKDEIDFVRDLDNIQKNKSPLRETHPEILNIFKEILGGEYEVQDEGSIWFSFDQDGISHQVPLHASSSSVKSLVDLNFYIKHIAKPGDLLIIDEPELNLHPANQRKLAKLFTRLMKAGVKLLMTTHSDYLIKEFNNLILLNYLFQGKEKLMEKYNYTEDDILDKNKVKVYISDQNTLTPATITDLGIEVGSFDQEIIEMNNFFNEATVNYDY
jgi:predicted ATPase